MPYSSRPLVFALPIALLSVGGCRRDETTVAPAVQAPDKPQQTERAVLEPAFAEQIHSIAVGYLDYPKVDDRPHFAPAPCAPMMAAEDTPVIRLSSAGPESLHSEKLYYLFVKNHESYLKPAEGSAPVGQVLVKQGYLAQEITNDQAKHRHARSIAERNGHKYMLGDPLALFIMMKLDEKTPNTDQGWIYGVADFDGKVQTAGVIKACANCHAHAPHDRVFGPMTGS